jgi:hypothetical protein
VYRAIRQIGRHSEALFGLQRVYEWDPAGEPPQSSVLQDFGSGSAGSDIAERRAQLDRHWDRVAALVRGGCRRSSSSAFARRTPRRTCFCSWKPTVAFSKPSTPRNWTHRSGLKRHHANSLDVATGCSRTTGARQLGNVHVADHEGLAHPSALLDDAQRVAQVQQDRAHDRHVEPAERRRQVVRGAVVGLGGARVALVWEPVAVPQAPHPFLKVVARSCEIDAAVRHHVPVDVWGELDRHHVGPRPSM